ncbi:SRPBCC family protein [Pleomorphomonas oryzae]|uniref:SRPBCC family protein n=1 Tax=Pleomorphomonas oryzae TaxID=261934 RepID=UPI000417DDB4|nr:SRPBCC domain-containing protein [Pleomorphomonas oryzae]
MTDVQTETRSVTLERQLPHPPEKVWRALTEQPLIDDWLMQSDFRPEVGHKFQLKADWGMVDCEVLEVDPQRSLAYRWDAYGLKSVVTWTLAATTTGTRLTMEQTGFQPGQDQFYQGAQAGWPRFLDAMEAVLAGL